MSADTPNNNGNQSPTSGNANGNDYDNMQRNRRGSVTAAAMANLFQRTNSTSAGTPVFPSAISNAALNEQRRRLSVTTLGLSGTSPPGGSMHIRRASLSTNNSDSIDENVIEEDDSPINARTAPTTPFSRRMSFGASAAIRGRPGGNSPGSGNGMPTATASATVTAAAQSFAAGNTTPPSVQRRGTFAAPSIPPRGPASSAQPPRMPQPPFSQASNTKRPRAASDLFSAAQKDQGFNWSEQLRSRAESTVMGSRPSFSFASGLSASPPRNGSVSFSSTTAAHERQRSVSEMPAPPSQAPKPPSPKRDPRPKPDHFQERILKGDFYMD